MVTRQPRKQWIIGAAAALGTLTRIRPDDMIACQQQAARSRLRKSPQQQAIGAIAMRQPRLNTRCVRAAHAPDAATGAIAEPIYLTTTFERDADGAYSRGYR